MARKSSKPTPGKSKNRARDLGEVVALGVEVSKDINESFEACRAAKKWSKRTLAEEALKKFLAEEGFYPLPSAPDA